jgi:MEMO1 family protein
MILIKAIFVTICCLLLIPCQAGCTENIKEPSVAGKFYPSDKKELKESVEGFLSKVQKGKRDGRLIAIISPHAGYRYSGQVAAHGYQEIKDSGIKKVILIGASHHAEFKGASVYTKGSFRTPLGDVEINEKLAGSLLNANADVVFNPGAFENEHSLEVQLPFLQTVLKDFTIIPILIGSPTKQTYDHLISKLSEILDDKTLIIASTDLSHYHDYHKAIEMDSRMISAIEKLSVVETGQLLQDGRSEMCGSFPVIITIEIARRQGANLGVLFKYANSGDTLDEKEHVVGYASIGLYKSPLTEKEKKDLLALAGKTINEYVRNGKAPEMQVDNQKYKSDGAVFVTIKKNGSLRGCIGHVQAIMPLYQSVIKNAIAACSGDPRFPPMTEEELKDINLEISILSPLSPVKDVKDIQIGKHGLVIRQGAHSGLLLPQVAGELGWDRDTFLKNLCAKAGLPEYAWRDAELYTFTAEIIK